MSDTREVAVPDIGDFADVPVIEILVSPGDEVAVDAPLVTLESDKATMDVPAPFAGKVLELSVSVGDTVSEGTPILTMETAEPGQISTEAAPAASAEAAAAEEATPDGGSSGTHASPPSGSRIPAANVPSGPAPSPSSVYASPSVRRLARELDIDLGQVKGSGRKGRITKEDVKRAREAPAGAPGGIPGLELAPWPQIDFEKYGEVERVPLSRIKKISGPNLARNWVMIPHVTHNDEADITDLEAFRKQINAEQQNVKVTMVALLIKACVGALRQFPELNSSLDGDELVIKRYYHLGFAADTPQGLLVPVIRDVDRKGLLEIAGELTELSAKAREGKLSAEEMRGSTFTISSLGGIGGTGFTPIVNAPEVAILGATRSKMQPVWDGTEFRPRLILPLSLSYDHRVVDGALAARFVAHLAGELSDLRRVLL
jgi:pyruvate dehydrogenase E2 component (dihydrolipoyllysine-residue acetyltransferase)